MTKSIKNIFSYNEEELRELAEDCRKKIIHSVSIHGGHLSSNLGVVEATISLFKVFDFNKDKIIFDVGHQSYTYKILTGRSLERLREKDGTSGFPNIEESSFDHYATGHSSTSISAAYGFAYARDLKNEDYEVISFIGDASLVNGVALEGLNLSGRSNHRMIIILNDNDMAISKPVGTIAKQLENNTSSKLFRDLGFEVIGPIDGHNFNDLIKAYKIAKESKKSIVVHIKTIKGKGYIYSENDTKGDWHGVSGFEVETGLFKENKTSWSNIYSNILFEKMRSDDKIVAIVPATGYGSALEPLFKTYKDRTIDVGIAEEHAVISATSMSLAGIKPVVSMYSTFLQRTYDQIIHDCARHNVNVTFLVDRAGIVGKDGESHQGIYDESFLIGIPNAVISMASTLNMAKQLFDNSFKTKSPYFIRFPKEDYTDIEDTRTYDVGKWIYETNKNSSKCIVTFGPVINKIKQRLKDEQIDIINAIYQKPLDNDFVNNMLKYDRVIIYNPYATKYGFANSLVESLVSLGYKGDISVMCVPNAFIKHSTVEETLKDNHIDIDDLINII